MEEQNFDPNESFDEAMSPVNIAESSDSDDDAPLKKKAFVQKSDKPAPPTQPEDTSGQKIRANEIRNLLQYLKDHPYTPDITYETYYRRYLKLHPEALVGWQCLYSRVLGMRRQYMLTKKWLHENVADIDENDIEKEVKLRCPFFYELDEVFKDKAFHVGQASQESEGKKPQRDTSVSNGVTVEQFPEVLQDRNDEIEVKRLEFERRKLNFESMKFEKENALAKERLLFETNMQQKEMELRKYEIETKRMYVENMMEVQKMRLEKEERLKMFRIELENKFKSREQNK
ncbi:uncharacterized protein LOC129802270 [Phlebotomus papatasi]|uniref:uncharacterized protein LOC129802270 n=1 Tax=Phlebotomus papatasi TaxID=29031 RepID=UPI00248367CB|nr:uncharacterized protein LOC129802270 [Phlebotomus papatasi]